jgi:hypothetical protein
MNHKSISSSQYPWFTAETTQNGKPLLFRGRQIPEQLFGAPPLPIIFVVTYAFDMLDWSGLPEPAQYELIGDFERKYMDAIECRGHGLLAFVITGNGIVRYHLYTANIDDASDVFADCELTKNLEITAGDDPHWEEYRSFLQGMHLE